MLFPSEEFLFAFLPIVLIGYYGLFRRNVTLKNIWLLISSLAFYAFGEPKYVLLMVAVILINYLMGLIIGSYLKKHTDTCKRPPVARFLLIVTVTVNIGILAWFKYVGFIIDEINRLTSTNIKLPMEIVLPIGISFFTFQAMSYVFDVYSGKVSAERNPLYVGLYVALFPQLIAGPIVRYSTVAEAIYGRSETLELFSEGIVRFLRGLIKKVIVANNMALIADAVWEMIVKGRLEASISLAWVGAIAYTFQIFFDFSGYSDMAIGLGRMFGFKFEENFNYPYIAGSVTEFFRRWHISLSGWFRDYIYIPLGGSRKGKGRTFINLFVVWLLTGIWHGANWTFVVWGLIYFAILSLEKLGGVKAGKRPLWGHLYTIFVVIIAWVVFRSESLSDALAYIKGMFGFGVPILVDKAALAYIKQNIIYFALAILGSLPILPKLNKFINDESKPKILLCISNLMYLLIFGAMVIIAISFIINKAYNPFIYFNF